MTAAPDEPVEPAAAQPLGHAHDLALAQRILAGDGPALDEFRARLHCVDRILMACNRRFHGALTLNDLEELAQDVALTVYRNLGSYRGIGALEAWIHSHCDHAYRNAWRRVLRERRRLRPLAEDEAVPAAVEPAPGFDDALQRCVQRLRDEEQWILHQSCHDNATLAQIAATMGINVNTVKSRYTRALQQLRHCLGGARP